VTTIDNHFLIIFDRIILSSPLPDLFALGRLFLESGQIPKVSQMKYAIKEENSDEFRKMAEKQNKKSFLTKSGKVQFFVQPDWDLFCRTRVNFSMDSGKFQ
jgi:hypothetical protein